MLVRLLRLRHIHPSGWQRFIVGDVPLVLAVLLVLADLASAWLLLALPLAVGAMVKLNDVVAGRMELLRPTRAGVATGEAPGGR